MGRITKKSLRANKAAFDREDAGVLASLAAQELCQARVIVDNGLHYVYCGGYSDNPAYYTVGKGWRCEKHGGSDKPSEVMKELAAL